MSYRYDVITIIFNPSSTGDAARRARELTRELKAMGVAGKVVSRPTKHAGHAEELACAAAAAGTPLIVSVSGDGGYHEVVNGVMAAGNPKAVCTVEGAGNANDHWRVVHGTKPLTERIMKHPRKMSLLKLQLTTSHDDGAKSLTRYAHSYIGLGLTAEIGQALNQTVLNPVNEKRIVIATLFNSQSFRVRRERQILRLDSLIMGNINEMAKQLKISDELDLDSPYFAVVKHHTQSTWAMLGKLLGMAVHSDSTTKKYRSYKLTLLSDAWLQMDGEVRRVANGSRLTVTRELEAIRTV